MGDILKWSGSKQQYFQHYSSLRVYFVFYCGVSHVCILTVTGSSFSLELSSPLMVQWNSWSLWKLMLQGYGPIITEYSSGISSRSLGPFCARNEQNSRQPVSGGAWFEQAQITYMKATAAHNHTYMQTQKHFRIHTNRETELRQACHAAVTQRKPAEEILQFGLEFSLKQQTFPLPLLHGQGSFYIQTRWQSSLRLPKITFSGPLQKSVGVSLF